MRRGDGRGRIGRELRPELRMRERSPEVCGRFPDRIVQISRAFADRAVKLCRDETRLPFHEVGIDLPGPEEGWFVRLVEREHVHQHDGGGIDRDLTVDREGRIKWAHERHDRLRSCWLYGVKLIRWRHSMLTSRCQYSNRMTYAQHQADAGRRCPDQPHSR